MDSNNIALIPESPLVSIIIPTYNRAYLIGETLDSVMAQTYNNWECILVDDGSTDDTVTKIMEYCNKDSRFQFLKRPPDRKAGGNAARNFGLENSLGAYIQWFDSDDLMHPELLEQQLDNLQKNGKEFSICLYDRYNEDFSKITKAATPQIMRNNFYYDYILQDFHANLPTILFSKKVIGKHRLSENLQKSQEYEFLPRIFREHQYDGVLLNTVLVKVRRHSNSITELLTPSKCESALKAMYMVTQLLTKNERRFKNKIARKYLKTLYLSFSNNMSGIFYRYLIKLPSFGFFKSLIAIPMLAFMYPLCLYLKFPKWHYKHIYKLYQ
ncbi:glycosyltransferase family 2 protein [Xanthomarina gelatinilytica]|uniref:glycosyltransferase family 2 protein n=1 Tax=Xanthomarina gelatinilytica TaxID=1137281 RepID=UPI003AA9C16D